MIKRVPKGAGASEQCPYSVTPGVLSALELAYWPCICINKGTLLMEKPLQMQGIFQGTHS